MNIFKKIAEVLRITKNSDCIKKAESLENHSQQSGNLHLRNLGLKANDIAAIAAILEDEKNTTNCPIKSLSLSYNSIGDEGAIEIARSLPSSIHEIGLVGCGIGDQGGYAMLDSIKKLPNLRMICIEENNFSDHLKTDFIFFKMSNPRIMVVF